MTDLALAHRDYLKKLIEVALPLPEINDASAYDKMPGIGPHPKGIHQWWARLPLPTARAVLFASVVDDPSSHPEKFPTEEAQNAERERLFGIIRELMQKKLHERPDVYAKAREEMLKHVGGKLPPVLDPFAGGGSIPLEAARLGFEAHAADLNPVAVLLNKCNLELVPRWLNRPPVNPRWRSSLLASMREAILPVEVVPGAPASSRQPPKNWFSRGYLPHFDHPGLIQSITFRLADSLPKEILDRWAGELKSFPETLRQKEHEKRIRNWLDQGHGACHLREPRIAMLVENALLHFDGERYHLMAWCVMPNHVHALIETIPGHALHDIVHSWKSFTATKANEWLGRQGAFWQREYHDRFIRDSKHLQQAVEYIEQNPVKAGLVEKADEWRFSSAGRKREDAGKDAGAIEGKEYNAGKDAGAPSRGASGLAEDVRYYGNLIQRRAIEKIGHLYPKVHIVQNKDGSWRHATEEEIQSGKRNVREADVIAWLWARTVASPNPAAQGAHVPLISTYWLSSKKRSLAWLEPVADRVNNTWRFEVRTGEPPDRSMVKQGTKLGRGAQFRCLLTDTPIPDQHIRQEIIAKRCRFSLTAIVADIGHGRVYLSANDYHTAVSREANPAWVLDEEMNQNDPNLVSGRGYGIKRWSELFTPRQLTAMVTLSDLVKEVRGDVVKDARAAGLFPADAEEYAKTVTTFLALALDRCADFNNGLCRWKPSGQQSMQLFARQAIPMVWDFCEPNIMSEKAVCWKTAVNICSDAIETIPTSMMTTGASHQTDAAGAWTDTRGLLVSTDPPYYDNIGYAALSDFFYVWLRRTIGDLYPDLFKTILVPKAPELTAAPERFDGDREKAKEHFETGFRKAFTTLREKMDSRFPLTVYYAFKQEDEEAGSEEQQEKSGEQGAGNKNGVDRTTGWETLLDALIGSGFQITATWPVRASQKWRMVAMGTNALASYIVLACRPRPADAPQCSRREFLNELKKELPTALRYLQQGNIAPVDLAQAAIGPGMSVFSRYAKVVESSGNAMTVRTALALINQVLDEVLAEQEAEFDADTRWALAWFEQFGMEEGEYGVAETLSRAKNTAVNGLVEAGIVAARSGKVRLIKRNELPEDWDPATDKRMPVWEATQQLIRALDQHGESGAAALLRKLGGTVGEMARELSYRLHKICEKKGWTAEALAYNSLVLAWPELTKLAQAAPYKKPGSFDWE
jgi:putative DNA methylase